MHGERGGGGGESSTGAFGTVPTVLVPWITHTHTPPPHTHNRLCRPAGATRGARRVEGFEPLPRVDVIPWRKRTIFPRL